MSVTEIVQQFIQGMHQTTWYEYVAVFAGIASVWFSRKENILVYPIGLINTIIYIFISFKYHLLGEASVNFYYTVMSLYGWWLWTRKDQIKKEIVLHISFSNQKEWIQQLSFFAVFYVAIFFALTAAKKSFADGAIPWADAFASATAYTGMWLMAKKKVESWYWWIATNIASIPLYFVKTLVFTSVQYVILLILAVAGLITWIQKAKQLEHR
ncbi:MAG: nicotinamide riboside transporter PnuC [Chitinophagaceae bacterium]|jgi:nicotinamide mononucleotide transporter|nr:nicotinamide mononucleotide transporter [Chitinophagaceae bacterium]MBP9740185.1 nicotinamide mononucleotide transporter [Chitinophagaceae bacterium]